MKNIQISKSAAQSVYHGILSPNLSEEATPKIEQPEFQWKANPSVSQAMNQVQSIDQK